MAFGINVTGNGNTITSYFWIYSPANIQPSIKGNIFIDSDGDGIANDYSNEHITELYYRGPDGLPIGDKIYESWTVGPQGINFANLSNGNYVLKLTGPDDYTCLSSGDDSPEIGEALSNNGCIYIAVDFIEGIVDRDNNYLLQKQ